MYICIYYAVSNKTIDKLLDEGKTEEEIINETLATTNCGECYNEFKEYVEKYNKNKKEI